MKKSSNPPKHSNKGKVYQRKAARGTPRFIEGTIFAPMKEEVYCGEYLMGPVIWKWNPMLKRYEFVAYND